MNYEYEFQALQGKLLSVSDLREDQVDFIALAIASTDASHESKVKALQTLINLYTI